MSDNLYFNWDGEPAVVVRGKELASLWYIPMGDSSWKAGTGALLAEWARGGKLSKPEFESEFGKIGEGLPNLPTT